MMTKDEVHYGEVHFCSFCKSLQFRYGDYYCAILEAPVAESGYCDLYEKDGKPTPAVSTVKPKVCDECIHNMGGMCSRDGSLAKKACTFYSTETTPAIEEVTYIDPDAYMVVEEEKTVSNYAYVDGTAESPYECTTCADAYYDANGIAMCRRFNAKLDMSDLSACIDYTEDSDEATETID
jgi:hypothetical protein